MTLEEAIKHAEEVAKEQRELFSLCPIPSEMCDPNKDCVSLKNGKNKGCIKCAEEYKHLAEWLKDYKRLKEQEHILDEIRAEIKALRNIRAEEFDIDSDVFDDRVILRSDVLEILDKYKMESENNK